jgi:hypothetical protein
MDDIARAWRKSTYSGNNGGQCVEIAGTASRTVAVRDSKDQQGPKLAFTPETWRAFTRSLKASYR